MSPAEIEAALRGHPAVAAAVVAGVPDARWGQVPAALVTLRATAEATPAELSAFLATRLASFKVPRRIVVVSRLPETAAGKPDRAAARQILARPDAVL